MSDGWVWLVLLSFQSVFVEQQLVRNARNSSFPWKLQLAIQTANSFPERFDFAEK